jgi:LPXTG-site transpeptidase (sortase) family protein
MHGIEEGTDDETLNEAIGHFEESEMEFGNACFAAHNRGYSVNYFADVKNLEIGDIIYYFVNGNEHEYKVSEILIIYETDWSMLENTEDNRITLITCVENRAEYRLCVQAVEVTD